MVTLDLREDEASSSIRRMGAFTDLLRRTARMGNPVAAWNLAVHYRRCGKEKEYRRWIRLAAEMGDRDARAFLNGEERELQFRPMG